MKRFDVVLDLIKNCKVGAEVGTCRGELAKHLLSNWNGRLYLIDAWRHFEELVDFNNPDHNGQLNNMAQTFMAVYGFGARVTMIRDLSTAASTMFPANSLDFVYIDAGHNKKSVTEDLMSWYPKVRTGGLLIGDDYFDGTTIVGNGITTVFEVKSTVDEFAKAIGKKVNICDVTGEDICMKQFYIVK